MTTTQAHASPSIWDSRRGGRTLDHAVQIGLYASGADVLNCPLCAKHIRAWAERGLGLGAMAMRARGVARQAADISLVGPASAASASASSRPRWVCRAAHSASILSAPLRMDPAVFC